MTRIKTISKALLLMMCAVAMTGSALAQDVVHAVAGAVTHVDKAGKTIAIKATDGSEQVFRFTEHTAIRTSGEAEKGAKMGALDTYFAGKEGTKVVVRYMGKGVDKTATVVEDFGKDTLKAGKGTVTHVDRAARTVSVKTEGGAEETYKLGSEAVVETDHGVVPAPATWPRKATRLPCTTRKKKAEKSCAFSRSSSKCEPRNCEFPSAAGILEDAHPETFRVRSFFGGVYVEKLFAGNLFDRELCDGSRTDRTRDGATSSSSPHADQAADSIRPRGPEHRHGSH